MDLGTRLIILVAAYYLVLYQERRVQVSSARKTVVLGTRATSGRGIYLRLGLFVVCDA